MCAADSGGICSSIPSWGKTEAALGVSTPPQALTHMLNTRLSGVFVEIHWVIKLYLFDANLGNKSFYII